MRSPVASDGARRHRRSQGRCCQHRRRIRRRERGAAPQSALLHPAPRRGENQRSSLPGEPGDAHGLDVLFPGSSFTCFRSLCFALILSFRTKLAPECARLLSDIDAATASLEKDANEGVISAIVPFVASSGIAYSPSHPAPPIDAPLTAILHVTFLLSFLSSSPTDAINCRKGLGSAPRVRHPGSSRAYPRASSSLVSTFRTTNR